MNISIVVPAHNEEKLIAETLAAANESLSDIGVGESELIVVDNMSTDKTAAIARSCGARVVEKTVRNIAAVRNCGAAAAKGETIFFIDADTRISKPVCPRLIIEMKDPKCYGGSFWVSYGDFERGWMKYYSMGWKFWGRLFNMRQGAAQFYRRSVFERLGGFDDSIYMGEDVDLFWRLTSLAKKEGGHVKIIDDLEVTTSSRRFDKMSVFRTLILTHPLYIILFRKRLEAWKEWYHRPVR